MRQSAMTISGAWTCASHATRAASRSSRARQSTKTRLRAIKHQQPMQVQTMFTPHVQAFNRWYRGLVGKVAEAIDANPDSLHADLKFKAGLILQIIPLRSPTIGGGAVAIRLKSTAFPLMEDNDFSHYVDIAVELMHRDYLPEIKSARLAAPDHRMGGPHRPRLDPVADGTDAQHPPDRARGRQSGRMTHILGKKSERMCRVCGCTDSQALPRWLRLGAARHQQSDRRVQLVRRATGLGPWQPCLCRYGRVAAANGAGAAMTHQIKPHRLDPHTLDKDDPGAIAAADNTSLVSREQDEAYCDAVRNSREWKARVRAFAAMREDA